MASCNRCGRRCDGRLCSQCELAKRDEEDRRNRGGDE